LADACCRGDAKVGDRRFRGAGVGRRVCWTGQEAPGGLAHLGQARGQNSG
jgi:hypothetical protein